VGVQKKWNFQGGRDISCGLILDIPDGRGIHMENLVLGGGGMELHKIFTKVCWVNIFLLFLPIFTIVTSEQ